MRKIFINFIFIVVLIILSGCSSTGNDLSGVENAYFICIEEIFNKGNITPENIKEILDDNLLNASDKNVKEYIYDGEFNSTYPTIVYRYTNNNEIIKVEYFKNTGNINKVSYETNDKSKNNKLLFLIENSGEEYNLKENSNTKFKIEFSFANLEEQFRVNNVILNEANVKSVFYKAYLELCKSIKNKDSISENNVKMILPETEVLNNNGQYFLQSEDELLFIDCNTVYYSTDKINLQYSANGLNKVIIEPDTLKEQEELYKLIY